MYKSLEFRPLYFFHYKECLEQYCVTNNALICLGSNLGKHFNLSFN